MFFDSPIRIKQQGAALITSLIFLVVLTLLGVVTMQSAGMELKMAGNMSSRKVAFEAAESCLTQSFNDPASFTFDNNGTDGYSDHSIGGGPSAATFSSERLFRMYTSPPRNSGYSAIQFTSAHNEFSCSGKAKNHARVTLNQGLYQIIPN